MDVIRSEIAGKVVVVTGAGSGIGRALWIGFSNEVGFRGNLDEWRRRWVRRRSGSLISDVLPFGRLWYGQGALGMYFMTPNIAADQVALRFAFDDETGDALKRTNTQVDFQKSHERSRSRHVIS